VIVGVALLTLKLAPLLTKPLTVTTTFPLAAPPGTGTTICVLLQLVGVAEVPLKLTVLAPCVAPKFVPVIVTDVPTGPDVGDRLLIIGGTAKLIALLDFPLTVTTIFPLDAPVGTGTKICVALQVIGVAVTPLNVAVLVPCVAPKFVPVIVTEAPGGPDVGLAEVIHGIPIPTPDDATQVLDAALFSAIT